MSGMPDDAFFAQEADDRDRRPMPGRSALRWPDGRPLALAFVVSAEYYELDPPADACLPRNVPGGFGRAPYPDFRAYSYREYGNRVGVFRVIDAFDKAGLRATLAVDAMTAQTRRIIVDECVARNWEVAAHGVAATRTISSRLSRDEEAAMIARSVGAVRDACGRAPLGWHGTEYGQSRITPELLCAHGIGYQLDSPDDEQPCELRTAAGPLVSLPMSIDLDDVFSYWHRKVPMHKWCRAIVAAAATLSGEDRPSGRVLIVNLHPWLIGQASRIGWLEEVLAGLREMPGVWFATAGEIYEEYRALRSP